jgi:hypothetical protein
LPRNAVARVGDQVISQTMYDQALRLYAGAAGPIDPPRYAQCITDQFKSQARARASLSPKRSKHSVYLFDENQVRQRCVSLHLNQISTTMSKLLTAIQTEQQASAEGIEVSDAEVDAAFQQQRATFAKGRSGAHFGEVERQSPAAERATLRTTLLDQKLTKLRRDRAAPVSEEQIKAFYKENMFIYSPRTQSLSQMYDSIRDTLEERAREDQDGKAARVLARLKARTICRPGYVVWQCSNG